MVTSKLNLTLILSILLTIISCNKKENTTLHGNIKGLSKGLIYLQQVKNNKLVTIDSVYVFGNSEFTFHFNLEEPDLFYLYLDKKDGTVFNDRLQLFLEPGELEFTTKLENFEQAAKLTGSKNHKKFEEYNAMIQKFNLDDLRLAQINALANKIGKQAFKDSVNVDKAKFIKRKYFYTVNFAMSNKNLEVSPYLAVNQIADASTSYLDTIYNSLPLKIKDSKYGKQLKALTKK